MDEAMNVEKLDGGLSALTEVLAAEARVAFVKVIKEENFFGPEYSRQSLKAHWSGAHGGFADQVLQRRWHDFLAGYKAANATVQAAGGALSARSPGTTS